MEFPDFSVVVDFFKRSQIMVLASESACRILKFWKVAVILIWTVREALVVYLQ